MRSRFIVIAVLALLLAALACATPPTPTPTAPPETPTGTLTPTNTATPTATATAPPEWHDVLIPNGDFDAFIGSDDFDKNQPQTYMDIFQGTVEDYNPLALAGGWLHKFWSPLFCNPTYAPERCQGVQDILDETGTVRHIANNSMDYPEYKDGVGENRVVDGTNSQQLFRPFAPFRAGIWQEIAAPPNSVCEVTALVQSWSATEWIEGALSNFPNPDAFNQSAWRIGIKEDPGPIYRLDDQGHVVYGWFQYGPWQIRHALDAADVQASEWYTGVPSRAYQLDHGMAVQPTHYDEFQLITATFDTGDNNEIIVFVENMTLFGFRYTDRYIESVNMRCRDAGPEPFVTPTPIQTPPTPEATPIGEVVDDPRQGTLVFTGTTNIRECEVTNWDEDVLRYFLGIYPTQVCPVVDQFEAGQAARNWQFINDAGDNTFAWLSTEPVEGDHSLATVAAVCYNGVSLARYYPDFVGSLDDLPSEWVDPCGTGGAQDVIAPQSLVSQGEFVSMDSGLILQIVFWLVAFVPLLGGAVGGLLAVVIDFLKAVLHLVGWEAEDEFWGRVVLFLNLVAAGILYFVLGGDPYTLPLPDNLAEIIVTATSLIALVTQLIGQLGIAKLVHWFLKLFAPTLVSTSNRKAALLPAGAARPN